MLIDLIFTVVVVSGFYLGFSPKVTGAVSRFFLVIFALLLSLNIAPYITEFVGSHYKTETGILFFFTVIVSFLISVMMIRLVMGYTGKFVQQDNMNLATNLSSGLLIGCLLLVAYGGLLYVVDEADVISKQTKRDSLTYSFAREFPEKARASMVSAKPIVEDFWEYITDGMEDNYKKSKKSGR
ncbi:MAG: putative membrane protein required for colicin V production [Paraglaciecola sp.]|jgi:uncharacterized membrane protein required for colicin V production